MKRSKLSGLVPTLILLSLLLGAIVVAFAVLAFVAWGAGWLLRLVFPFSLFEGMLLGSLFTTTAAIIVFRLMGLLPEGELPPGTVILESPGEVSGHTSRIPSARFYTTPDERTWEALLRQEMADDIYVELQDRVNLDDVQLQELAIRLSESGLALLKRKTPGSPSLTISLSALRREIQRMGQQPYDSEIMNAAVEGINTAVAFRAAEVYTLLESQRWQALAKVHGYA